MRNALLLTLTLSLAGCTGGLEHVVLGETSLRPTGHIAAPAIEESSGLTASMRYPGVFWTLNDSGDSARIFPIYIDGRSVPGFEEGIRVEGAVNIDWEALSNDGEGNLIIGAFGNNANLRRDLSILVVPEPELAPGATAKVGQRYRFHYPDQESFPPALMNFDAEALFVHAGKVHILTKHRSDRATQLYRLDNPSTTDETTLTLLQRFPIGQMVTGAEMNPSTGQLAVLTYHSVWVFDLNNTNPDDLLAKPVFRKAIHARQCEAIAWAGEDMLLITNEQRDIFRLPLDTLKPVE